MMFVGLLNTFIAAFFLSFTFGVTAYGSPKSVSLDLDGGRQVEIVDASPETYANKKVNLNGRSHTLKAYGSLYVSFMASMIATELVYCSREFVPYIADNEETPVCRQQLQQMLLDPGMSLGIVAMAFTNLELYRRGDPILQNFLRSMMKPKKVEAAIQISQSVLQTLTMGAGMIMQTSTSSTWNSPFIVKCLGEIKRGVSHTKTVDYRSSPAEVEGARAQVSSEIEQAMEKKDCQDAWNFFKDAESGTLSEIYITVISLGVSTAISAGVIGSIKFIGLSMLGASPVGLGLTAGFIVANMVIELVDRYLEPIIRAFYHRARARNFLGDAMASIRQGLINFNETQNFVETHSKIDGCLRFAGDSMVTPYAQRACVEFQWKEVRNFHILDAIRNYKKNINYHRESQLNQFIEAHNQWQQKVSDVITSFASFQAVVKKIFEIRARLSENKDEDLDTSYNLFEPIGIIEGEIHHPHDSFNSQENLFSHFRPQSYNQESQLNSLQIQSIQSLLKTLRQEIREIFSDPSKTHSIFGGKKSSETLKTFLYRIDSLDDSIESGDRRQIQVELWRFKGLFMRESSHFLLSEESQRRVKNLLYHPVTGLNQRTLFAFYEFEAAQIPFLNQEVLPDPDQDDGQARLRKGVVQGAAPLAALATISEVERQFPTTNIPAKVISHLACSDKGEMELFYRDGQSSRILFPNILSRPQDLDCAYYPQAQENTFQPYPQKEYLVGPNGIYREMGTDVALHRVYEFKGREVIGLLEVLVDPKTPLRWQSYQEFSAYWSRVMKPQFLLFLLQHRGEYQTMLANFFRPTASSCDSDLSFARRQLCQSRRRYSVDTLLSEHELEKRLESWSLQHASNSTYYTYMVGAYETFSDEIRTYQYIASKTLGEDNPIAKLFQSLLPQALTMRESLRVLEEIGQTDFNSMGTSELLKQISIDPVFESLGDEKVQTFLDSFQTIRLALLSAQTTLREKGLATDYVEGNTVELQDGQNIIALEMLRNLDQSLQYFMDVLLDQYIGGNKIIFVPQDN